MKLELKHLVAYLPYSVRIANGDGSWYLHYEALPDPDYVSISTVLAHPNKCKLILRPMSDLRQFFFETDALYPSTIKNYAINIKNQSVSYIEFTHLLEKHFDVFGLIEQGLAIDINSLK